MHAPLQLPETACCQLQVQEEALEQEDYQTAADMRDAAGLRYRGWWYGSSSGETAPHLLRVEPCYGRLGGFWVSMSDIISIEVRTC